MKLEKSNINEALEIHLLSNTIFEGHKALKKAIELKREFPKYSYKSIPTKIICDDTVYTGFMSIATVSALFGKKPFNVYQMLLRNNGVFSINDKLYGIYIIMDETMGIQNDNISEFFEKYKI